MEKKLETEFVVDNIIVDCGGAKLEFWFDGNNKISGANPKTNAFSLVNIDDCPGATPLCKKVCYVNALEINNKNVHDKFRINSKNIRIILKNEDHIITVASHFSEWIKQNVKDRFRWHVSGDIISWNYAKFIAKVCILTPEIDFWIYSRSYDLLIPLLNIDNLVINLSVDEDNYAGAVKMHWQYGLRMCYLSTDNNLPVLPRGSVIFPEHKIRGHDLKEPTTSEWWQGLTLSQKKMVCARDFFGQTKKRRCGPCKKCLVK